MKWTRTYLTAQGTKYTQLKILIVKPKKYLLSFLVNLVFLLVNILGAAL